MPNTREIKLIDRYDFEDLLVINDLKGVAGIIIEYFIISQESH